MPINYPSNGLVFVLIGPSGAGKSTIARMLADSLPELYLNRKYTTRPVRSQDEEKLTEDIFVDEEKFDELERGGFFLEVVQPFNQPYRYGQPRVHIDLPTQYPLLVLRSFVLDKLLKYYSNIAVIHVTASRQILQRRMKVRNQKNADVVDRLAILEKELALGMQYADITLINEAAIDECLSDVVAFVASKLATHKMKA